MISRRRDSFRRIISSLLISSVVFLWSSRIFSRSIEVNLCRRISRIFVACFSEKEKRSMREARASGVFFAFLMRAMTSSIWSRAIFNPSRRWSLSRALLSSKVDRLVTISLRNFTNSEMISFRLRYLGSLLTIVRCVYRVYSESAGRFHLVLVR